MEQLCECKREVFYLDRLGSRFGCVPLHGTALGMGRDTRPPARWSERRNRRPEFKTQFSFQGKHWAGGEWQEVRLEPERRIALRGAAQAEARRSTSSARRPGEGGGRSAELGEGAPNRRTEWQPSSTDAIQRLIKGDSLD